MDILLQDKLKNRIGENIYLKLNSLAEEEVSLSLQMDLVDRYGEKKYYRQRHLLNNLLSEFKIFKDLKILIAPTEIVRIIFLSRLVFAVKDKNEYGQRAPGVYDYWGEKEKGLGAIISKKLQDLYDASSVNRTLITEISEFNNSKDDPQEFFDELFKKLELPFVCFFDNEKLIKRYKNDYPHFKKYKLDDAKRKYKAPSFGYRTVGTSGYVYRYAESWLRTFLDMLKIASFLYRPQIDYGDGNVRPMAPVAPVLLDSGAEGCYCWDEDKKMPWEKVPDGCLYLSFGYRGFSKMWLDKRAWGGIEKFIIENKVILDNMENPWTQTNVRDIIPALDILRSVTQIPDSGAKILLIYCCLEHLFVPNGVKFDNKKYIIGGINAIKPGLLPWFNDLYSVRCEYAHKGFAIRDEKMFKLILRSVHNIFSLIRTKLSSNK